MIRVRLLFPTVRIATRFDLVRGAEWSLFLTALAMTAMTVWGQLRITGPITLAVFTLVAAFRNGLDRQTAARRLAVLAVTIAVSYLFRIYAPSLVAHRVGRFTLVTGLGLTALLSLPTEVLARLRDVIERLRTAPNSHLGLFVAIFGISLPASYFYTTTTVHVWTGDTMPLVPTVVRMATAGDRELSSFVSPAGLFRWEACGPGRPYFVREVPGRAGVYSTYPAGMEVFAWPTVLALRVADMNLMDDDLILQIEKWSASLLTGASLGLFFLIGLRLGSPVGAFVVTWLMATGSVFSSTLGMLLWQQGGIVFWMLLALAIEIRADGKPSWKGLLVQALACGWILACRPSAVTFLVPFGLWILLRDLRRGLLLPALALLCYLPWGWMYWSIYRNPFGPSMGFLGEKWLPGEYILDVLFSPGRGLFVFQPFLALLVLRVIPAAHGETGPAGWKFFALASVGLHLFLIASWQCWWGGFCYGSRLVAETVPLLALFAVRPAGWLLERRGGWIALAGLAWIGLAIHTPCLYHDAWLWNADPISADAHPERMWDWRHPPFLYHLVPNP